MIVRRRLTVNLCEQYSSLPEGWMARPPWRWTRVAWWPHHPAYHSPWWQTFDLHTIRRKI